MQADTDEPVSPRRAIKLLLLAWLSGIAFIDAACAPVESTRPDTTAMCDAARMDQVEREARRTFKEVHWLRCPQAPAPTM
jgi:hypothetical protein